MARKRKTDDKKEAPADGAVEQDDAPGSPDEDTAPQAAASESDGESGSAGGTADVSGAGDNGDAGAAESVAADSEDSEAAPEEVDDSPPVEGWADDPVGIHEGLPFASPFVDLVFSGEAPHLEFVEAEYPPGSSVSVGTWVDRGDGFQTLRIMNPTNVIDGDAEQVLFDALCGLAVRQDAELRLLRAAVEPFAVQVEDAEAKRGPAFAASNTVPISLGRLQGLRDALRFRALVPADANDEAILEAAQPTESEG